MRSIKDMKFQAYLMSNLTITENGFGYVKLEESILQEYKVDAATAGNMINSFNYTEEMIAWGFFSQDKMNNNIRGSVRSRGPVINETLAHFGGGGHAFASGIRVPDFDKVDEVIKALDEVCREYQENDK